ncbi:MAG: tryptophan-rich sensory protein, partial [Novosphingobium sp.]|nr:tryptophan-rich sensory protein [Novosphingobium sp.]
MSLLASRGQLRASLARWALLLVPAVLLAGFLSGQFAGSGPDNPWFATLAKPAIYPPPAVFPVVWAVLYVLMGFAFAVVCSSWGARGRGLAIAFFLVQLALNLAWAPVFFGSHRIFGAL